MGTWPSRWGEVLAHRASAGVEPVPTEEPAAKPSPAPKAKPRAARSEAVTLLATLQREARFIDFIMEPLASYSDAQIGAAARDVHRDCGKVLERMFSLQSILAEEEGSQVEVTAGFRRRSLSIDRQCGRRSAVSRPVGSPWLGSGHLPDAGVVGQ